MATLSDIAICGWDLGGAHLKRVDLDPQGAVIGVHQVACPLWQGIDVLRAVIADNYQPHPGIRHAVTMTGELCDHFQTRALGTQAILSVCAEVLGNDIQVYAGRSGWYSLADVPRAGHVDIASANWRATADVVAMSIDNALLIDVGSTTTDLIPIVDGECVSRGHDDQTRLQFGELVYTGVVRTPLMAICKRLPFEGAWQSLAAEVFATMADIYRILGELPEHADLHPSADGRDKSVLGSARRVSRMLGVDLVAEQTAIEDVARYFAYRQFDAVLQALFLVESAARAPGRTIVAAGVGSFLVAKIAAFLGWRLVEFSSLFDVPAGRSYALSHCAPAAAVAKLLTASK